MYKQPPSRSNRSKGFKSKHVLQICVLLAVCFWLIYQVKRSHDKTDVFNTEDKKVVEKVHSNAEILRLGRKDLPKITETGTNKHGFDEEEQEAEEEENKHEDDEQDVEDNISEDKENEIDENDLEKAEIAHEKEHIDEDNERDDNDVDDENRSETEEHEEDEGGKKADHDEDDVKLDEKVHDGDSTNTHEAREEQYKGDDASSEVSHDNQTIMTEAENVNIEHTNDITVNNNGTSTNVIVREVKEPENNLILSQNGTIEGGSGNENQTTVKNILEHINKSEDIDDENGLQLVGSSNNTKDVNTNDVVDSIEDNGRVDLDEDANVIPHDPIDASDNTITQDEKDSRMDLDTLPEITNEVQNSDDAEVE